MQRLPNYTNAYIPRAKLDKYLLDPIKEPNKSRVFNSLGYNLGNTDQLEADILDGLKHNSGAVFDKNEHGIPAEVIMELGIAKKGKIRTAWMYDNGSNKPRFVTAYPE